MPVPAQDAAAVGDAVGAVVLDVVVGQRHPVDARPREDLRQLRLAGEGEAGAVEAPIASVTGISWLAMARSAALKSRRTTPLVPGQLVAGHGVGVKTGSQQPCPVTRAVPPSKGKSMPLPRRTTRVVDAAVGEGVAAGHQGPGARLVPAVAIGQRHGRRAAARHRPCGHGHCRPGGVRRWPARASMAPGRVAATSAEPPLRMTRPTCLAGRRCRTSA